MSNHKRGIADTLLADGSLFIHLDPRVPGVVIPPWLKHQPQVVLQVGYNMPIPITDLQIDDNSIFGTLSFSRTPFRCVIPWNAVFALYGDSDRGLVWTDSMPAEVAAEVAREEQRRAEGKSAVVTLKNVKPGLSLVKGGAKLTTPARGVLRSVK